MKEPSEQNETEIAGAVTDISGKIDTTDIDADPALLSVLMTVIKEMPESQGYSDDILTKISLEAIAEGVMSDQNWLRSKLEHYGNAPISAGAVAKSSEYTIDDIDTGEQITPLAENAEQAQTNAQESKDKKAESLKIEIAVVQKLSCLEDLTKALEQHQKWIESVINPNIENFAGRANLTGSVFQSLDLKGLDFRCATLRDVDFSGADLSGANLTGADLSGANLTDTNLSHSKMRRIKLDDTILEQTNLTSADMRNADFKGAKFNKANLKNVVFDDDKIAQKVQQQNKEEQATEAPVEASIESSDDNQS